MHLIGREEKMRKKKPVVLVSIIFILYLTAIFSNAEQDKRKRSPNSTHRDIYSKSKVHTRRIGYNQQPSSRVLPPKQRYSIPVRDNFLRLDPDIIVKLKMPLSDFEKAYLFSEYLSKEESRMRMGESRSVESMIQIIERNPYVDYAEPNHTARIPEKPDDFGNYSFERPHRVRSTRRFPEALKKEDMLHKDIHGKTNLVLPATNAGREAVKKYNRIPPYPETNDNMRETQSSDTKRILRSKAKIYTYRDSEGRLVITNYYRYKSKTKKK
jgi:hypothetical protein